MMRMKVTVDSSTSSSSEGDVGGGKGMLSACLGAASFVWAGAETGH